MADRSETLRAFYARFVTERGSALDPRIAQAFAAVPREPFAGPGPWKVLSIALWSRHALVTGYIQTPDDDPAFLYQDSLIALDAGRGINIGEPSFHAHCLDALAVQPGEQVLQIGAGSGYYTAILAHLVGSLGQVHAFEIDPDLAARARRNLAHLPWVDLHARSGIAADLPKSDAVYVNAGLTQPSWAWLDALKPGGRLLFPLQPVGGRGGMLMIRRPHGTGVVWPARFISRAAFIECQGSQSEETGRALAVAFAGGGWPKVRSLRLDDMPDASCWFAGDGWWLSTAAPTPQASAG